MKYKKLWKWTYIYSRNNLSKINDGAYITDLDIIMQPALIALELNIFQKKLKKQLEIKILREIFPEYENMIQ